MYSDNRPTTRLSMYAQDEGVVVKRGDSPHGCDLLGAREALIFLENGEFHLFYDGAGLKGWLACLAVSKDLKHWSKKEPIVSNEEQIENSSIYYETTNNTWFLFTNHIGITDKDGEYTDAIWVYWSDDPTQWDERCKAVVMDSSNCTWSKVCIGLASVIPVGNRPAILYDAPGRESASHTKRDVGLAWLNLPLNPPNKRNN